MRPYSEDLRERVVFAMEGGLSCRAAADRFGVAPSTAGNWHRAYRTRQSFAPLLIGGDRRSKLLDEAVWIAGHLAATPELRLLDVQHDLSARGVEVSYASVQRMVKRLGLRIKKTIYATEQDRPDVALARQLWRADQAGLDFSRLVFADETGTTTAMTRTHGWGRKGEPLYGKTPHGHWMTQTFVAGLSCRDILAPMLIPCPMTGKIFKQWLTECLIPEMAPGSIVVIDNLPAHKVAGVRECLENAGMGLLYLPPYSPDLNPIEMAFAKLKRLLRRLAPRSFDAICNALASILEMFSPKECSNYINHAGYVQI